jgi:hypothetical protein
MLLVSTVAGSGDYDLLVEAISGLWRLFLACGGYFWLGGCCWPGTLLGGDWSCWRASLLVVVCGCAGLCLCFCGDAAVCVGASE